MLSRLAAIGLVLLSLVAATASLSQTRFKSLSADPATKNAAHRAVSPFAGKWTYRSYHNRPAVIVGEDEKKALSLLFGEGVMTIEDTDLATLKGTFDMGGGYVLDLKGTVRWQTYVSPTIFDIKGFGRAGTPTDGWEYDYVGYLAWEWPNGIDQVPAIVGTVLRAKPHGNAQAGYTASFIAAKQAPASP